ncbi:zinc-finger domain-containing protein [Tistrella bauzanensis]|jgi:uncharacterized Zn-finger protein|uniref:Zinc-finger domain-containing protein n=2 Tax=Tistrella TaxID=171436 RepID=A0ABU9YKK1_9PROT|nr:zinc-finger domain-containing protein [Tistrella bauzanensis]GGB55242.1 hypothetical protein GCM10011505_40270 [Tistrella bauzanensis]
MEPVETVIVEQTHVACEGSGGALGHPRVFLNMEGKGYVDCPYCGRHFVLKPGAKVAHGH